MEHCFTGNEMNVAFFLGVWATVALQGALALLVSGIKALTKAVGNFLINRE